MSTKNFNVKNGLTTGNLLISEANVTLGNVSNLHISGGNSGYVLSTDGSGNLSWADAAGVQSPAPMPIVIDEGNTLTIAANYQGLFGTPITVNGNLVIDGALIDVSGQGAAGSNAQISFNDQGNPAGLNGFTINKNTGNLSVPGNIIVSGNILPSGDLTFDIGSPIRRFRDAYFSGNTIYLGNANITAEGNTIVLPAGTSVQGEAPIGNVATINFDGNAGNILYGNGVFANALTTVGATGVAGPTGATGLTGATGQAGTIGVDGSTGATGPQGPVGATGASGYVGSDGATGATGIQGPVGATGASGYVGSDGATGATGATGPQGATGPVAGSNTQVIFNDAGSPGANANFTYNKTTSNLTVVGNIIDTTGAFYGNGAGLTNLAGANVTGQVGNALVSGTVYTGAQPNITSVGTLSSLAVTGNVSSGNLFANTGIIGGNTLTISNTASIGGNLSMNSKNITSLAEPVNPQDAATKSYVDSVAQGLHVHAPCSAATPTTLNSITGGTVTYNNGTNGVGATLTTTATYTTIDGVNIATVGTRILVKNEANTAWNGIYVYTSSTVLTRASDFDTPVEMAGGDFTFVTNGTLYNDTGWVCTDPVLVVGTDPVTFVQFSGAGTYTAGTGLTLTGTVFSISNTTVTAGSYGNGDRVATFTVNGQGQLTAASNTAIAANAANLTGTTLATSVVNSSLTSVGTLGSLAVTENGTFGNVYANGGTIGALTLKGEGGNISNIQGANVSGTVASATTAGTVTTAAQPNITSVGTLSSLSVTGNTTSGNVYANSGTIGASLLSGTLTTAAQPNITSVGTLSSLTVTGKITAGQLQGDGGNIANIQVGNVTGLGNISTINRDGNASNVLYGNGVFAGALAGATGAVGATGIQGATGPAGATGAVGAATVVSTADTFTGDGVTTAFTLTASPTSTAYTIVNIDGVLQLKTAYSIVGSTLTFTEAPASGQVIEVQSLTSGSAVGATGATGVQGATGVIGYLTSTVNTFTGTGSQSTFTMTVAPLSIAYTNVVIDGVTQLKNAYSVNGTSLIFTAPPSNGAVIDVQIFTGGNAVGPTGATGTIGATGASGIAVVSTTVDTFTGNGVATSYTLSVTPTSKNNTIVNIDGIIQLGSVYSLTGAVLTFVAPPSNGANIQVLSFTSGSAVGATGATGAFGVINSVTNTFTGNGVQTAFTLTVAPASVDYTNVNVNGVYQLKSAYSVNGTTLTFTSPPGNGAGIDVQIMNGGSAVGSTGATGVQGATGAAAATIPQAYTWFLT